MVHWEKSNLTKLQCFGFFGANASGQCFPFTTPFSLWTSSCSIRFQTFSFAAEKKLLQIYCLCFCCRRPGPLCCFVVLAVIIIIISVVSAFVAAAALNTKEFPICCCLLFASESMDCIAIAWSSGGALILPLGSPPSSYSIQSKFVTPLCFIVGRFRFLYLEVGNECLPVFGPDFCRWLPLLSLERGQSRGPRAWQMPS